MPGRRRWSRNYDTLSFEGSWRNWLFVHEHLSGYVWTKAALAALERARGEVFRAEEALARKKVDPDKLPPEALNFPFRTTPYLHQKRGLFISREMEAFAYFMEMGTGKTKVTCDKAAYGWSIGAIDTLLVASRNGVHEQWVNEEVPKHMPDWCRWKAAPPLYTSMYAKDEKKFEEVLAYKDGLRVFAINIEALSHQSGYDRVQKVLNRSRALFTIDESTKIKNHTSTRGKNAIILGKEAVWRLILSGAPITQGIEDLYAQFMFLNPGILPVGSYTDFEHRYCKMGGYEGKEIVGYKNVEELQRYIDPYVFRVLKKDCLDLPEKVYMERHVLMTDDQRKKYRAMKNELLLQLENGQLVTAQNAAVAVSKLQQITSGFLLDENGEVAWFANPNPRVQELLNVLEEASDEQAIIWCRFRYDVRVVTDALKEASISFGEFHGGTSAEDRQKAREDLRSGKVRCLVCTQAADAGNNFQTASLAVYYSNSFDADFRWQSEDRIHRIGQTKICTYVDLVAPRTVDGHIVKALADKKDVATGMLDRPAGHNKDESVVALARSVLQEDT